MGIETNEGYLGHEEAEDKEYPPEEIDRDIDLEFPDKLTEGRIKAYRICGRNGVIYRDSKTGRFISLKGLMKIVKGE